MRTKIQDYRVDLRELADGVEDQLLSVQGVDYADQGLFLELAQVYLAGVGIYL